MDYTPKAEERADALVIVGREEPGRGYYVILRSPGGRSVYLGPYDNPDVAKLEAGRVRCFVAAVIQEARDASQELDDVLVGGAVARNQSITIIPAAEIRRQFAADGLTLGSVDGAVSVADIANE